MAAGRILWTWWSLINKHCVSALPDGLWCYILLGPPMVPFCPNGAFLSTGWVCCGQAEGPMGEKGEDPRACKPDGTKVSEVRKNKGIEGKKELAFQISLFSLMQSPAWRSIINTFSFLKKKQSAGFQGALILGQCPRSSPGGRLPESHHLQGYHWLHDELHRSWYSASLMNTRSF